MSLIIENLVHRASKCPFACFLKFMSSVSFIYVLHLAAFHQADVSPYLFTLLVDSVALVAVLSLAFHSNCQFHKEDKN